MMLNRWLMGCQCAEALQLWLRLRLRARRLVLGLRESALGDEWVDTLFVIYLAGPDFFVFVKTQSVTVRSRLFVMCSRYCYRIFSRIYYVSCSLCAIVRLSLLH